MSSESNLPINPWLAGRIMAYRKAFPDEQALRERYREAMKEDPGLGWDEFIMEDTLQQALREHPFLATKIEDTPLSYEVKARLNIQDAERVHYILQITEEEFRQCIGITGDNIKEIGRYLAKNGFHLEKGNGRNTGKVNLRSDEGERQRRHEGFAYRLTEAERLNNECENVPSRIREAVRMYQIAHEYCEANDIDVQRRASLLWRYCKFVMEKRTFCPDIMENFHDYLAEMVTRFETTYGPMDPIVGDAHRKAGEMLMALGEYREALYRLNVAAKIFDEADEQEELFDCLQLIEEANQRCGTRKEES